MKRFLCFALALLIAIANIPAMAIAADDENSNAVKVIASGDCGNGESHVYWELDADGKLLITGDGGMMDTWQHADYPWVEYGNVVSEIIIGENVTSIGEHAFEFFTKLESVQIPLSVTYIGNGAFYSALESTHFYYPGTKTEWNAIEKGDDTTGVLGSTVIYNVSSMEEHRQVVRVVAPTCWSRGYTVYTCNCGRTWNGSYTGEALRHSFDYDGSNCNYCGEAEPLAYGDCGNGESHVYWELNADGKLLITGDGGMMDTWQHADYPWVEYGNVVSEIIIGENVTSIGEHAFEFFTKLESVQIPLSVTYIGNGAFYSALESTHFYYPGTKTEWNAIEKGDDTTGVLGSFFHYNAASEAEHWQVTEVVYPTCLTPGYTSYTCPCGKNRVGNELPATGHSYTAVVTAPTCTERGYTTYTCHCGDSYVDSYVPATGHSFGAWVETKAPTCTEKGSERRDCQNCDHYETRDVAATGHSYTAVVTKPTCTEQGYTTYTCHCGDSYVDSYVPATGHSFGNWVETKAPTCTEKGSERRDCANCDHYEIRDIAATGHSHTAVVTKPTCTEQGYTTYTCHCGDSYVDDYVPATGHSFGNWVETKAPTCTEKGTERRDCANCDHYETRDVAATGHSHTAVVTAPTCTAQGYTTYTCHCGDSYVDDYVPATGHSYGDWVTIVEPTEETEGKAERTCSACGHKETKTLPVLSHTHSYTAVVTAPTCTEQGYTTHTCRCGDSYTDTYVSATGHKFGAWTQTKAPACTEKGQERRDCQNCDHYETRDVAATGHSHTAVVTSPTCTEQGYTTYTCHCGNAYIDEYVAATGHSYGEWVTTIAPTGSKEGEEAHTCANCGHVETRKLPPTGIIDPNEPQIQVSQEISVAGDTVDVEVSLKNNPGINTFTLTIDYDTSKLVLTGVTADPALGGTFIFNDKTATVAWQSGSDTSYDGVAFTLRFAVLADVEGDAAVTLTYKPGNICNYDEEDVNFAIVAGGVTVLDYVPGDINGDGIVNNKDLNRLMKYLTDESTEVNTAALDVNGDGVVNNKDLNRLMKYLTDDTVEIH